MVFVIWFGKDLMVKVMSYLVWLFIVSLVLIFLLLIFYWNFVVIDQVDFGLLLLIGYDGILIIVWLGIFIMVFFFNFLLIVFFLWFLSVKSMRKILVVILLNVNVFKLFFVLVC